MPATRHNPVTMPPINDNTRFTFKAASLFAVATFVIVATWNVSRFMADAGEFQRATLVRLGTLESSFKTVAETTRIAADAANKVAQDLRDVQREVVSDRWTGSDMREWAYQLERQNRESRRDTTNKDLLVPEVRTSQKTK